MRVNYKKLERDLKSAKAVALAVPYTGEGGSCNFDSVALCLPYGTREASVQRVAKAAGVRAHKFTRPYKHFSISFPAEGQSAHFTAVAEAAAESLRANGWDVVVRYQTD